jgi:hypothetical protein
MGRHLNINFVLTLLLVTTFLTLNINASGQDLTIKFYNMTGYDVDQIRVDDTYVGSISKDSVSSFISFPGFWLDGSSPIENISAIFQKDYIKNHPYHMECATMFRETTTGELHLDINVRTVDGTEYLRMTRHQ